MSTLSARSNVWKKIVFFIWLLMTWISELAGQQRMIILKNLKWLTQPTANLNTILIYYNISNEWMKGLKQSCVKFEKVVPQIRSSFIDFKHVSASCIWTLFICTMYYTTVTSMLRKNLLRKKALRLRH